jgi:tubulin polyglutamylase TTLL4
VASSCGRGIKVIGKKTRINRKEGYLASKYVCKPHLINGFKYDLRVYVLVSSYDPLRVYVYNDGLVRFATEKYTLNP